MSTLLPFIRVALADALAFVLPVSCAGCGAEDVALCAPCAALLTRPERLVRTVHGGLAVHSAFRYEGDVARMLRALKEDGRTALARPLGRALADRAAVAFAGEHVAFVPVPSSASAMRRRGYRVVELLLRRSGLPALPALRVIRRTADQRALDREERARNARNSLAALPAVRGRSVVIVDDVVTTGATLADAARALRAGGADVRGALTLAATPKRRGGA